MEKMSGSREESTLPALDQYVAPGLRLWMLIALVSGVLLIMVVVVCCFMRIRIPRTKRQIDMIAAKRKMRSKKSGDAGQHVTDERAQAIVMNSMNQKPASSGPRKPHSQSHERKPLNEKMAKTQTAV